MLSRKLIDAFRNQHHAKLLTSSVHRQILYNKNNEVVGIATNDMGISKDGSKKDTFQRGVELKGMLF